MTIVCGNDFSTNASQAAEVAAELAKRLGQSLTLVHVIDEIGAELAVETRNDAIYEPVRQRMQEQATALAERHGVVVEPVTLPGIAPRKLVEIAASVQAQLIVVSSLSTQQHWWSVGSVTERIAQMSTVPVLVVRQPAGLLEWLRGERALRTMVGAEPASDSHEALEYAVGLANVNPCELWVTQIAWPAEEYYRFGISAPVPLDHLRPELKSLLLRDLETWGKRVEGAADAHYLVRPGVGRVDTHLALLASEQAADLLVVGRRQRSAGARFWQASVSRGVLHHATTNVITVPGQGAGTIDDAPIDIRHVLVCTDLSDFSLRAIRVGYGLLPAGGHVSLLYVKNPSDTVESSYLAERLRSLVPPEAVARGITTQVEIAEDDVCSLGICRAASRLAVDAICMATHGRGGLTKLLLGSQAEAVLQRSDKPVVLVPSPRSS